MNQNNDLQKKIGEGISAKMMERNTLIKLLSTKVWGCGLATAPRVLDCLNEHGYAVMLRKDVEEALRHAQTCVPFPSDCYDKIVRALAQFTTKQEVK